MNSWSSFFSTVASASAALTGLIFVAVSINLSKIIESRLLIARAAKALFSLGELLLVSICCLIPGQGPRFLGGELTLLGLFFLIVINRAQYVASHDNPYVTRKAGFAYGALTQVAAVPFLAGGVCMLLLRPEASYLIAVGMVFSLIAALIDAWVLLIEIQR